MHMKMKLSAASINAYGREEESYDTFVGVESPVNSVCAAHHKHIFQDHDIHYYLT